MYTDELMFAQGILKCRPSMTRSWSSCPSATPKPILDWVEEAYQFALVKLSRKISFSQP